MTSTTASPVPRPGAARRRWLLGGTGGNEQLTAQLGVILLLLFAALGVTIPDLSGLVGEHLFIGFLLLGPVLAKMGSTGYRFVRYYTRNPAYREKGPPQPALRIIAPIVVLSTVVVFVTGIALLIAGPNHRSPWLMLHKLSFIVWVVFMALHVLGHLAEMPHSLRAARETRSAVPGMPTGAPGRGAAIVGSLAVSLVLALALIPTYSSWTTNGVFRHHHDRETAVTSHTRPPATLG